MTVFLGTGGYAFMPRSLYDPACDIKGNISINSGERIYHVRGQEYYDETVIRAEYGERWFCTEDEARNEGWSKAGR
ncbi:hypothetical protein J2Y63_006874 [Shinella sp. BE166]|uniref:sunset domain-containing protein n=1 Tax=Shinella sp. BE166 TaxID=3373918 RepID=UPI003EBDFFFB